MNYLREMNAFVDWLETNPLDAMTQVLWFHLMAINNKCNWPEWFAVANLTLQAKLGADKKTIIKQRNVLVQKGLIAYKNQGREAGRYKMLSVDARMGGNIPPNLPPNEGLTETSVELFPRSVHRPWNRSWTRPGNRTWYHYIN